MLNQYTIIQLQNGMRCVHAPATGKVNYIGVVVNIGSRDESEQLHGLAHFVEHTLFKGTSTRRSWQISNRMESIGGELNAYTSKEETVIYTNAPAGYSKRAIELLSDIIANSNFPNNELEKERDVVIEEIYSYRDSPADSVYDDFEELAYAGNALSHNILGTPESVKNLTADDCRRFLDDFYTPDNMVLYCVADITASQFEKYAEQYFGKLHHSCKALNRIAPTPVAKFEKTYSRNSHQANTIVGTHLFGRNDPRRHALFLLNNYIGGPSMNSVLNRLLREQRGWVYTVDSSVSLLSNAGLMAIYFGCDAEKVDKCADIIMKELQSLANKQLSERKFEAIKRQYCGQLILTSDHKESRAMSLAKSLLYFNKIHDIDTSTECIKRVTAEQFQQIAAMICENKLSRLTIQ